MSTNEAETKIFLLWEWKPKNQEQTERQQQESESASKPITLVQEDAACINVA